MHYRVYLDVFFLINLIMDYVVVSIVCRIQKIQAASIGKMLKRKVLASLTGAIWACVVVCLRLFNGAWIFVSYVIICLMMVAILNGSIKIKKLVMGAGLMYLVTCALSGIIYIFGRTDFIVVIGIGIMALPVFKMIFAYVESINRIGSYKGMAVLEFNGKSITVGALCDTGNSLYDPVSKEGVNVIEADVIWEIIENPPEVMVRLIPYSSVGKEKSLIPIVRIERITFITGNDKVVADKPLCAIYKGHFAEKTDYKIILHPSIFREKGGV